MSLYSTPGRRRTWGPASQAGVVLNFLDSCRFTFLSAVMKAVQRTSFISRMRCRTVFLNLFLSLTFQPGMFLKVLETPAWPFFSDTFFSAQGVL